MTNSKTRSVRALVIGLLLAVGVGAPVASILGNAPHRATASAAEVAEPTVYEMPEETVRATTTLPVVDVVGQAPRRTSRAKKDAGEERTMHCVHRSLDSDWQAGVTACGMI